MAIGVWRDCNADTAHKVFMDLEYRQTWDKFTMAVDLVEVGDCEGEGRAEARDSGDVSDIVYFGTKFPFPFSNRDYLFAR